MVEGLLLHSGHQGNQVHHRLSAEAVIGSISSSVSAKVTSQRVPHFEKTDPSNSENFVPIVVAFRNHGYICRFFEENAVMTGSEVGICNSNCEDRRSGINIILRQLTEGTLYNR